MWKTSLSALACVPMLAGATCHPGVSRGLRGYWSFDKSAGPGGRHFPKLVRRGGVKAVPGRSGRALGFDGSGDVYSVGVGPGLRPTVLTVCAWVRIPPAFQRPGWILAQGDNYGLAVNRYSSGAVCFYYHDRAGWPDVASPDVAINDGRWRHVTAVFDPAARRLSVYKDGLRVAVARAGGPIRYTLGAGFTIGSMQGGRRIRGAIDEVRVYARVLNQSEIEELAMTDTARRPAPGERIPPFAPGRRIPVGVVFHRDTIWRSDGSGDNWCITWAADDSQVTSMDDGDWLNVHWGYHNHLYRILGGPDRFDRRDIPAYPVFSGREGSWFGYGVVSAGGMLYASVSKTPGPQWSGPFRGVKLLKSPDNGKTWFRIARDGSERRFDGPNDPGRNEVSPAEMFFLEEGGLPHQKRIAYPFSYFDFVQCGRDNSAAKDEFLYMYSPEGAHSNRLLLARAPAATVGVRSTWEYFVRYDGSGRPVWTRELRKRGYVHVFPAAARDGNVFGWYSWLPSVVWNPGLGLYIMVNGGTYAGHGMTDTDADYYDAWMHERTGSLGFWWAENPWGPWREFFYTDSWTADDPANRTYQPKLSPKWISAGGRDMILIWSDAMKNAEGKSHTVNYRWNQMRITIRMKP